MLFLNAVGEVYHSNHWNGKKLSKESQTLLRKLIPITPMTLMSMMSGGIGAMTSPEMIRISSCYSMFVDSEKAFGSFLKDVQMGKLTERYGVKIREQHTIVKPWPLRVTHETTKEEFEIRCATTHTGFERYMEFEKL
jgi:hypothetical protein